MIIIYTDKYSIIYEDGALEVYDIFTGLPAIYSVDYIESVINDYLLDNNNSVAV